MNIIKKYWDSVYLYVLLLVPGFCMCAGIYWTICKALGLYEELGWWQIGLFDGSQLVYLAIAIYFIYQNKKDSSYIPEHLVCIKGYVIFILFVQYNVILYLFASDYVWECTFLFFAIIVFLFDTKLMFLNIMSYFFSLLIAHILRPDAFLPLKHEKVVEIMAWRLMIFVLTALCILIIVYFGERFLMQARENREENMQLMEKQLKYYKDMELLDKEIRKFRHDIKNHFICMETLFNNERIEELREYFKDLQQSYSAKEKIFFSGNDIVDAILHYDLRRDCKEVVEVTVYGKLPELKTVSAMDLCTLFSNLLSNAIASANQCTELPKPQINVRFSGGNTYFCIEISNSVLTQGRIKREKNRDRNHGHGIHKMKDVLEKYG